VIGADEAMRNLPDLTRCTHVLVEVLFGKQVFRRCKRPRGPHPKFCDKHRVEVKDRGGWKGHYHRLPSRGVPRQSPLRKTLKGA
jgi:hypothetical protein